MTPAHKVKYSYITTDLQNTMSNQIVPARLPKGNMRYVDHDQLMSRHYEYQEMKKLNLCY